MARSYFCDHCKHAMAKGGRVTLNIAVNEPHKAPFPLSFTKELCRLGGLCLGFFRGLAAAR